MKILGVALIASLIQAATQQVPGASVGGIVVKWGTADPLSQVIVELRADGGGRPVASTATSEIGEFVFPNVAAGRYRMFATRSGFAPAEFGQRRPNGAGQGISLAPGERRSGLQIAMTAGATVYGRILDRNGQPLPFADVRIEKMDYRSGRAAVIPVQTAITNDLGEYRIFWIAPGQYYIRASASNNQTYGGTMLVNPGGADTSGATFGATTRPTARVTRPVGLEDGESFAPLYYPSVPSIENASLVELRAGTEFNASFTMIPARTRQVRGVVVDQSTGQPVQSGLRMSLYPVDRYTQTGGTTLQFNPDNGVFRFSGIRSGTHELNAVVGDLTGRLVVDVPDRDVDVTVNVSLPIGLSGRLRFEGQPPAGFPSDLTRVVEIVIRGTSQLTANTTATGEFEFQKVPVGSYQIGVQPFAPLADLPLPAGAAPSGLTRPRPPVPALWQDAYVKSILMEERDILNGELLVEGRPLSAIVVVVGFNGGLVEGRALNAKQEPVSNAVVLLAPDGPPPIRSDRFRSVSTDESGKFAIRGIAPGNYTVYAWEDVDPGAWFNPAFMRLYESSGQPIRIGDAQRQSLELRVIPVP